MIKNLNIYTFYILLSFLGICAGNWVLINTIAAEQFGTNIRATVATSTPNFIRSFVFFMSAGLQLLETKTGLLKASIGIGVIVLTLSIIGSINLKETFGKDLDFIEK